MSALFTLCPIFLALASLAAPIDRHALVSRHNVVLTSFDGDRPLQVGNGNFAFGIDITGLQTFAAFNTMSDWGWNSSPLPPGTSKKTESRPDETSGESTEPATESMSGSQAVLTLTG